MSSGHIYLGISESKEEKETNAFSSHNPDEGFLIRVNQAGNGIFRTVNEFKGFKRVKKRLTKLKSFFCDCDCPKDIRDDKEKLADFKNGVLNRILESGVKVSSLVETKNGYQFYYNIRDGFQEPTEENFELYAAVQEYLIKYFDGDKQAKDTIRMLRVPNFYHHKDPRFPFLCEEIDCEDIVDSRASFSYEEMLDHFFSMSKSDVVNYLNSLTPSEPVKVTESSDSIWKRSENWPMRECLKTLEGTEFLRVTVSFKDNQNGTTQVLFNGKTSGKFFDTKSNSSKSLKFWLMDRHGNRKAYEALVFLEERFQNLKESLSL